MVTFSMDDTAQSGTPRSRPPLPFAKRAFASSTASPYATSPRRAVPGSVRKTLTTRDDGSAGSLSRSFAGTSNIFRSSTASESPRPTPFSPSFSQAPKQKLFDAPAGSTPAHMRVQREKIAYSSARGIAKKMPDVQTFSMRIEEPARELTGEVLENKVPKGWDPKNPIYADQYLADLCPEEFDDEQRRQWFCILDMRRLKHTADEIFLRKGWRLNILSFAKEYEKSRTLIMLHYDLYQFKNVKADPETIRRWRGEHGLAPLENDDSAATPTKASAATSANKKRKAFDEASDEDLREPVSKSNKRRASDHKGEDAEALFASVTPVLAAPAQAPTPSNNKRKASSDEEEGGSQPSKLQKPTSGARSAFERAANKGTTTPSATPAKPSIFASKPAGNSLMQSVLKNNAKSDAAQQAASSTGNIFGHLSDSGSAKNSGQDADAESETDSEPEEVEGPSAKRPAFGTSTGESAAGTRESTPGRGLFDRVTKDSNGEPVRAATPTGETTSAMFPPKDQTWNPSSTPIKFAPAAQPSSLFGQPKEAPSSIFKTTPAAPTSNLFGAPQKDTNADTSKNGSESDKENGSHEAQEAVSESKPQQPAMGSIFSEKPKEATAEKPQAAPTGLFGAAPIKPPSNLFGNATKSAEAPSTTPPAVMESSTLFGAKPTEPEKSSAQTASPSLFGAPKPATEQNEATAAPAASIFGAQKPLFGTSAPTEKKDAAPSLFGAKPDEKKDGAGAASSLFGAKPAAATSSNLFGSGTTTPAAQTTSLFGSNAGSGATTPSAAPPTFSFGTSANKQTETAAPASKPLFAPPKSPPASSATGNLFDGGPMKQDDKSPAKPLFGGMNSSATSTPAPSFSFGGNSTQSTSNTSNLFGNTLSHASNNAVNGSGTSIFGNNGTTTTPAGTPGGSFNFSFGGSTTNGGDNAGRQSGATFSNPFATNGGDTSGSKSAPSSFTFGQDQSTSSNTGGFQFGAGGMATGTSFGSSTSFGNNSSNPPSFGAGSSGGMFSFGATNTSQPNNQAAAPPAFLAPPSTGTNTPSNLGGGSSLATTPARGTPEPSADGSGAAATSTDNKDGDEEAEKHEQINLADAAEEGEETLHEVRAKVLKFVSLEEAAETKSKSPWSTQGVGNLRLLKNQESGNVRLLLRAEPRGHVALNRSVMPDFDYKAEEKYVKITTGNATGDGLETWMIQVKTKDVARTLADKLEEHKGANKK